MNLKAIILAAAIASPAFAQDPIPHSSQAVNYACDGGAVLQVAYLNLENGQSFATIAWAGKLVPMRLWPAASGARYIADDEQNSYRWHTKGEEGTLSFLAADHTATPVDILTGCKAIG